MVSMSEENLQNSKVRFQRHQIPKANCTGTRLSGVVKCPFCDAVKSALKWNIESQDTADSAKGLRTNIVLKSETLL